MTRQATTAESVDDTTEKTVFDKWASIYDACHMRELGYTLEQFLETPWAALNAAGQGEALQSIEAGFEPLLPAQVHIARRLREQGTGTAANDSPHRTTKNEGA